MTHQHKARTWDGFYEHCRCGACSGDIRDINGYRCSSFKEWPIESKRVGDPMTMKLRLQNLWRAVCYLLRHGHPCRHGAPDLPPWLRCNFGADEIRICRECRWIEKRIVVKHVALS